MRIRYFAWIKDITNKDNDVIDINHPKTIQELKKYLEEIKGDQSAAPVTDQSTQQTL